MGWFTRWRERQRELAAGVDADLVQANRQRWKLSLSLWALLFVLLGIQAKIKLPAIAQKIAINERARVGRVRTDLARSRGLGSKKNSGRRRRVFS